MPTLHVKVYGQRFAPLAHFQYRVGHCARRVGGNTEFTLEFRAQWAAAAKHQHNRTQVYNFAWTLRTLRTQS